jgi:hypothetical protein
MRSFQVEATEESLYVSVSDRTPGVVVRVGRPTGIEAQMGLDA